MRLCIVLLGCTASGGVSYYKDIKPLAEEKCVMCHQDGGIAPFSLTSYEDFAAKKEKVKVAVESRVMPPWLAAPGCSQYVSDRSLSDDQIKTFTDWIEGGAAKGNEADYRAPEQPAAGLSRVDTTLMMAEPYTPKITPDEYRCFLLDWPAQTTQYLTGFRARPGDGRIVHHVIAFYASPENVAAYQALDDADPDPGYACFGGPGNGGQRANWLGGWAPGSPGNDFAAGTGLRIEPGSKVILQVHYNTSTTMPVPDQTAIDFKIDSTVEKEAVVQPFTNVSWVKNHTMEIPAGAEDTMYSYAADPTPFLSLLTNGLLKDGVPVTVWGATLHMHQHGTQAVTRLEHADGKSECMLDIPRWNFHWQGSYGFEKPKTLAPGDELYLECHWDNSAAAQPQQNGAQLPPETLNWGEGTGDEMCLAAFYLTQ
jgi:hypothetical protein